jgi:hypothetical protein
MKIRQKPRRILHPRRPPGAVAGLAPGQAVAYWGRDEPSGSVLAVCARVGSVESLPPGYLIATFDTCKHDVWLNPDVRAMTDRLGLRLVCTCTRCVGAGG